MFGMNALKSCRTYGRKKIRLSVPNNSDTGIINTSPVPADEGANDSQSNDHQAIRVLNQLSYTMFSTLKNNRSLTPIYEKKTLQSFKPAPHISTSIRSRSSLQETNTKTTDSASSLETVESEETYLSSYMTLPSGVSTFLNQLQSDMMMSSSLSTDDTLQGGDNTITETMRKEGHATHYADVEDIVETEVLGEPEADQIGVSTADFNFKQSTMINSSCPLGTINMGLPEDISDIYESRTRKKKRSTCVKKTSLSKERSLTRTKATLNESSAHISTSFSEETYLSSYMTLPSGVSTFLNQLQSDMMMSSSLSKENTLQGRDNASDLDCTVTETMRKEGHATHVDVEDIVETDVLGEPEADQIGVSTADFNFKQSTMINSSCPLGTINMGLPEDISEIYDSRTRKKKRSTCVKKTSLSKERSLTRTKAILNESSAHISTSFSGKKVYRLGNLNVSSGVLVKKTLKPALTKPNNNEAIRHTPKPTCSEALEEMSKSKSSVIAKHVSFKQPIDCTFPINEVTSQSLQASHTIKYFQTKTSTPQKMTNTLALDLSPVAQESLSQLEPNQTWGIVNSQEIAPDSPSSSSSGIEQELVMQAPSSQELCCIVGQTFVTKKMGQLKRFHAHGGPGDAGSIPRDILSEN